MSANMHNFVGIFTPAQRAAVKVALERLAVEMQQGPLHPVFVKELAAEGDPLSHRDMNDMAAALDGMGIIRPNQMLAAITFAQRDAIAAGLRVMYSLVLHNDIKGQNPEVESLYTNGGRHPGIGHEEIMALASVLQGAGDSPEDDPSELSEALGDIRTNHLKIVK